MSLPFAVVLNQQAGRGLAAREWPRLEAELYARGLPFVLLSARTGAEALAQVQALPPTQPVLTVGGDGTVNAILPALVGTKRPLAIIPLGSGNDFAGFLGLKPGDFTTALDRLQTGPRLLDALDVQIVRGTQAGTRRWLLNGLGMGLDAQVNEEMLRAPAAWPGFWRYLWGALRALGRPRRSRVDVVVDGQPLYQGPGVLCAVMNGSRVGGGFYLSPESDTSDGQLNVVVGGDLKRLELLWLMLKVLRGQHLHEKGVYHRSGQSVSVHWQKPMFVHLDGEICGEVLELRAEVVPGAVTLLNV